MQYLGKFTEALPLTRTGYKIAAKRVSFYTQWPAPLSKCEKKFDGVAWFKTPPGLKRPPSVITEVNPDDINELYANKKVHRIRLL